MFGNVPIAKTADGVNIRKLRRSDVADSLAAIPAAIDNQWAPRSILEDIVEHGTSPDDWLPSRDKQARSEFMRSLIDNERVIINRAYIFNSSILRAEYLSDLETRQSFAKLLENGSIVLHLVNEESPTQLPSFPIENVKEVEKAWRDTCVRANSIPALRLSWDDRENQADFAKYLYNPFVKRLLSLGGVDPGRACADLGIEKSKATSLRRSLGLLVEYVNRQVAFEGKSISRNDLYQHFVITEGGSVASRHYQGDRLRLALKEFADLVYNVNSSESFGILSSSPNETLNRSALQEFDASSPNGEDMNPEELARCFRQFAFDAIRPAYKITRLDLLNSSDIFRIRNTGAYRDYIDYLGRFMRTARSDFAGSLIPKSGQDATAQGLLNTYESLVKTIEDSRDRRLDEEWCSNLSFRIETGGFSVEIDAGSASMKFDGLSLLRSSWNRSVPYVVKCVVGSKNFTAQSLGTAFEISRGYMSNPQDQLKELQEKLIEYTSFNWYGDEEKINEAASSRSEDMSLFDYVG